MRSEAERLLGFFYCIERMKTWITEVGNRRDGTQDTHN